MFSVTTVLFYCGKIKLIVNPLHPQKLYKNICIFRSLRIFAATFLHVLYGDTFGTPYVMQWFIVIL